MAEREPRLRTVGVVLAGGVGRRVGLGTPKQLLEIAGKTILEHTLALFEEAPEIDEVLVLMAPGFTDEVERLVERNGFAKVVQILEGGETRSETTWRALRALGPQECLVLLHDAVRPLAERRIITDCVEALRTCSAVEVAIPSSDTIVVTSRGPEGEIVSDVPDRSTLRRVQTPQCFRLSVIREAYQRAFADPGFGDRPATDDCGVVLRYLPEVPIHVVNGSERNMKVTHPVDLLVADTLLRLAASDVPPASAPALRAALKGRTVVVFGTGAELVELAGEYGARVFSFPGALEGVGAEDPGAVADALAHAAKETGGIDYVVNVPDAPPPDRLEALDEAVIAESVNVNLLGSVTVARAALPHLRESRGRLLLHAPAEGVLGESLRSAVAGLTRALAREWASYGVRVNCVALDPGGDPRTVATTSLDVLASGVTGQVVDARS